MSFRKLSTGTIALLMILFLTAMSNDADVKAYTPEGTWDYTAVGVPSGYEVGKIVITREGEEYGATIVFSEYYSVKGEDVVYKNKEITFTVYVEGEEVKLSGTFDGDEFTGSAALYDGTYEMTAKRAAEE